MGLFVIGCLIAMFFNGLASLRFKFAREELEILENALHDDMEIGVNGVGKSKDRWDACSTRFNYIYLDREVTAYLNPMCGMGGMYKLEHYKGPNEFPSKEEEYYFVNKAHALLREHYNSFK